MAYHRATEVKADLRAVHYSLGQDLRREQHSPCFHDGIYVLPAR